MSSADAKPRPFVPLTLLTLAITSALLALYEWMELLLVEAGGTAICSVNEKLDCSTVWRSPFASWVHSHLGMPLAGLGLVWGLGAVGLSIFLLARLLGQRERHAAESALKLWGLVGAAACIGFLAVTLQLNTFCLLCLVTYAVTWAFAALAFAGLTPASPVALLRQGSVPSLIAALVAYGALLYPGLRGGHSPQPAAADSTSELVEQLAQAPAAEKKAVGMAREAFKSAKQIDPSRFPVRARRGAADAPVQVVDFTDVLCPHCRALAENLEALELVADDHVFSLEARQFPLDGECNPFVGAPRGDGIRCLGAKVQICAEGTPAFWKVHADIFAAQSSLSKDKLLEIGSQALPREKLQACVDAPETAEKLKQDIDYAMLVEPQGTPIVMVNKRDTMPIPGFLLALVLAKGDVDSPLFAQVATTPAPGERAHAH